MININIKNKRFSLLKLLLILIACFCFFKIYNVYALVNDDLEFMPNTAYLKAKYNNTYLRDNCHNGVHECYNLNIDIKDFFTGKGDNEKRYFLEYNENGWSSTGNYSITYILLFSQPVKLEEVVSYSNDLTYKYVSYHFGAFYDYGDNEYFNGASFIQLRYFPEENVNYGSHGYFDAYWHNNLGRTGYFSIPWATYKLNTSTNEYEVYRGQENELLAKNFNLRNITTDYIDTNKVLPSDEIEIPESSMNLPKPDPTSGMNDFEKIVYHLKHFPNYIIDSIKSLFVPNTSMLKDTLISEYEYLQERLGFLFYPIELITDFLNRIINIPNNAPIINIPNISLFGNTFINSYSYNLNDLLLDNNISLIYNYYMLFMRFIIVLSLALYGKKQFKATIGGGN